MTSLAIDYETGEAGAGTGPKMVLVPGSCSTGAAWRPVLAEWPGPLAWATTSLLGYGGTAERRSAADPDIRHEVAAVEAVVRRAGEPVHLVGHSFGGLVALAVALAGRVRLASLAILEAPALSILRLPGEEAHLRAFRALTRAYFAAWQAGDAEAVKLMIDFYAGAGTWDAWPQRLRAHVAATTPVNILDWATAESFALHPAMLADLAVPTLVLCGAASHPAIRRANELIAWNLPRAALETIDGAAHFMIATHPAGVARALARHVRAAAPADAIPGI